jgi:hypothetical protein
VITYFEASALIKLVVDEQGTERAQALWDQADPAVTSVASFAEARAALASARRAGRLASEAHASAKHELRRHLDQVLPITLTGSLAHAAGEAAERHVLRGYDAIHLVSARSLARDPVVMVTWDRALAGAARDAGLLVAGLEAV